MQNLSDQVHQITHAQLHLFKLNMSCLTSMILRILDVRLGQLVQASKVWFIRLVNPLCTWGGGGRMGHMDPQLSKLPNALK